MHALVEKENKRYKPVRQNHELTGIEPAKRLFKVVVNNHSQQEKEMVVKIDGDTDKTMASRQFGLPPQPTRYLKCTEYDWF